MTKFRITASQREAIRILSEEDPALEAPLTQMIDDLYSFESHVSESPDVEAYFLKRDLAPGIVKMALNIIPRMIEHRYKDYTGPGYLFNEETLRAATTTYAYLAGFEHGRRLERGMSEGEGS